MVNIGGQYYDVCQYKPSYCKVDNICDMMKQKIPPPVCPKSLVKKGFYCHCPIKKASGCNFKFCT